MTAFPWAPSERSTEARALYSAAEAERVLHPERFGLSGGGLLRQHQKRFSDASAPPEGLLRLADEAGSAAQLNALGSRAIRRLLAASASKGERFTSHIREHPEVGARRVNAPIFIVGGWRTGSTLLHRALAATNALRGVTFWEWADPFTAASGSAEECNRAAANAEQGFTYQYTLNPLKRQVHPAGAHMVEECVVGMGSDGKNWALPSSVWAPEYARWLASQDFTSSYELHRYTLQMLSSKNPEERWVLKAPGHTPELAALLSVYPDAQIIHLHRDVVDVVASGANLFCVFQSTYSDNVDPKAIGAFQLEALGSWFDRATRVRETSTNPDQFLDVDYRALASDPSACIAKVLEWLGIDGETLAEAHRYLQATPHERSYRYEAGDFGLDEGTIRERMSAYCQHFGLDD